MTKAEEFLKLAAKQATDRDSFASTADDKIGSMCVYLEEALGKPASVERTELEHMTEDETVDGFKGTLISRRGCHFALEINIGDLSWDYCSEIVPEGKYFVTHVDERNVIDVTQDAGMKSWCDWIINTWIPAQMAETIDGAIGLQLSKLKP
jgi:hypothetical protein